MSDAGSGCFAVAGEASIYRAAELREQLVQWLAAAPEGAQLVLDLSQVTELDSAGLQLLLSAHKTARLQRVQLQLQGINPVVQEVLDVLGLSAQLSLPCSEGAR